MAPNRFQRFYNHAMLHLRASRPTWTAGERRNTTFTIYHSEPTVREHYNSHVTEMPNLAALVPNVPWTHADVVETRSHGERPVARIPHHSQPHNGGDTAAIRATVNTVVARLTAPRPPVAAGAPLLLALLLLLTPTSEATTQATTAATMTATTAATIARAKTSRLTVIGPHFHGPGIQMSWT